jgi:hypothetical protein
MFSCLALISENALWMNHTQDIGLYRLLPPTKFPFCDFCPKTKVASRPEIFSVTAKQTQVHASE